MSEIGNRDDRHERGTQRAEEEKNNDDDDEERFRKGFDDFVDRVVDVLGRVVGDVALHAGGQFALDILQLGADAASRRRSSSRWAGPRFP